MLKNTNDYQTELRKERFLLQFKQTPIMVFGNLIASLALIMLLRDVIPNKLLFIWLASIYISCAGVLLFYLYIKPSFSQLSTIPDTKFYYYLPFAFGILWGLTGIIFFTPESTTHIAFLIIFLFGMNSGGLPSLSSSWLAFAAFAIPSLLPLAIQLLTHNQNPSTFLWLSITILTYLITLLFFSRTIFNSITESLKIRYENLELVKKLRLQTEAAEKANQDKSIFLAAASHDLRQPIHSLSLFTSAISQEIQTKRGRSLLGNIESANQVMLDLLNSLLDISKLDAKVITPQFQHINLSPLIHTLVDEFLPITQQNNLQLHWKACDCITQTDPVLLSNILRNLLQNAIRYTQNGKILLSCRIRKKFILVQVWDTGSGIDKKHHQVIFDEFQQLNNPERDQNKGLGLGLAICRRLSILLKHPLSLKSEPGKGSVFSIKLPLIDPKTINTIQRSQINDNQTYDVVNFEKAVFLVIDDNHMVLNATSTLLEGWGAKVLQADSLETAIQHAENQNNNDHPIVDIIVADYRLRNNTTGVDAIEAFNNVSHHQAIGLLITGDTEPARLSEASSHGLPLLHKPVKEAHLKNALSKLLRIIEKV